MDIIEAPKAIERNLSTTHAFTNPTANSPNDGMAFSESADRRSWKTMSDFLAEVFA